jgi:hypothetical protein
MTGRRPALAPLVRILVVGILLLLAVGGVVLLVAASPFVLRWIARSADDWTLLSEVGQAYGGASAILSALALCGITVSLILQWRQTRVTQLYSARHHHLDLSRLVLDNPESLVIEGAGATLDPHASSMVIANLWVANWATAWQLGALSETSLRACGARLFEADFARRWWQSWGATYATTWRGRRFVEILTEECRKRDAADPAAGTRPAVPVNRQRESSARSAVTAVAAVAALVVAIAAFRRANRLRP